MTEAALSEYTSGANYSFNGIQVISDSDVPNLPNIKVELMTETALSEYTLGANHSSNGIQVISVSDVPKLPDIKVEIVTEAAHIRSQSFI